MRGILAIFHVLRAINSAGILGGGTLEANLAQLTHDLPVVILGQDDAVEVHVLRPVG